MAAFPGLTSLPTGISIPSSLPMLDTGVSNLTSPYNGLQYGFRGDQYIGTKDRIYGSYANNSFTLDNPANRVGFSNHNIQDNWYAQANWTHTFTANILNEMGGVPMSLHYNGRINCPMELGRHQAIFVSASYTSPAADQSPSFIKYTMKRSFARMYWRTMGGSLEWLMGMYFGKTSSMLPDTKEAEGAAPTQVVAR